MFHQRQWRRSPQWSDKITLELRIVGGLCLLVIVARQLLISFAWNRLSLSLAMVPGDLLLVGAVINNSLIQRQIHGQLYRELRCGWLKRHWYITEKLTIGLLVAASVIGMWLIIDTLNANADLIRRRPLGPAFQVWHTAFAALIVTRLAINWLYTGAIIALTWRRPARPSIAAKRQLLTIVLVAVYLVLLASGLTWNNNHDRLAASNRYGKSYVLIP